jgi:hypothetical protein
MKKIFLFLALFNLAAHSMEGDIRQDHAFYFDDKNLTKEAKAILKEIDMKFRDESDKNKKEHCPEEKQRLSDIGNNLQKIYQQRGYPEFFFKKICENIKQEMELALNRFQKDKAESIARNYFQNKEPERKWTQDKITQVIQEGKGNGLDQLFMEWLSKLTKEPFEENRTHIISDDGDFEL